MSINDTIKGMVDRLNNPVKEKKKEEEVDKDGYVICVNCGASTQYRGEDNVFMRNNYYHGCGQFCDNCEKNQRG